MLKRLSIYGLLAVMFSLSGCDDKEKEGSLLTLNFRLTYGGTPVVMFENFQYPTGQSMYFTRFNMFLSDVKLVNSKGSQLLEDIAYIDLTNSHATKELMFKGYDFKIEGVEAAVYDSIVLSIGVPKVSNDKTPSSLSDKPLSDQAEYWGDWKSYIFARTEGKIDLDFDGKAETGFSLHTGDNEAFRTIRLKFPIVVTTDNNAKYYVEVDLKKIFSGSKLYDIKTTPQIHSRDQSAQVKELADNMSKALIIK